jgi:hypothetical protein
LQVSAVITGARDILQDKVAPYRYPDESLIEIVNEGMLEARRIRPDLFIGRLSADLALVTSLSDPMPLPQQFYGPLKNYVVGRAEMRDDEFTNDKRATTLYGAFMAALLKGA